MSTTNVGDGGSAPATTAIVLPSTSYTVTGTVSSPTSVAVGGLALQLVDQNVGGDVKLVTGTTGSLGQFTLTAEISLATLVAHHKTSPDLQVQVLLDGQVAASSAVQYNAGTDVVLDVVLPSTFPLASEYEALTGALASLYPGSLANLQESAVSQDITYLANKSGWDARAVAMASLAAQLSQSAEAILSATPSTGTSPPGATQSPVATTSRQHGGYGHLKCPRDSGHNGSRSRRRRSAHPDCCDYCP